MPNAVLKGFCFFLIFNRKDPFKKNICICSVLYWFMHTIDFINVCLTFCLKELKVYAWRIPWTEDPGGPQSMRSQSQTGLKQLRTHAKC